MADTTETGCRSPPVLAYGPAATDADTASWGGARSSRGRQAGTGRLEEKKKKGFGIRLTVEEDELIRRERDATGARSLTAVFERAILDLLADQEELGRAGLTVPSSPLARLDMPARQFQLAASTHRAIEETVARHGWSRQIVARAALLRLAREAAGRNRRETEADDGGEGPA